MSNPDHVKIYEGNSILAMRIKAELENSNIRVFLKDKGESNRLTGYPVSHNNYQELFVYSTDANKAIKNVELIKAEMDI